MDFKPQLAGGGEIERTETGWKLRIPAGSGTSYRLSQLDDYAGLRRSMYPWKPPLRLTLRARVLSGHETGTWGFGLWNDPYGFSLGAGSQLLRLPALPQAMWFFGASPKNYLSFRNDLAANGFFAQVLRSPRFSAAMVPAGLAFPFTPKTTRRLISGIVKEDAARVEADPHTWRTYAMEWEPNRTEFRVDGTLLLESAVSPRGPLGMVIWIDNQYAAFEPGGRLRWGVEANPEAAWLEIAGIRVGG